ncbi:Huntingtin-interacting protein K [Sarcoptes scabiei]|nr:Huntingtin-interacting protein K [Sarcoptes scabiei]
MSKSRSSMMILPLWALLIVINSSDARNPSKYDWFFNLNLNNPRPQPQPNHIFLKPPTNELTHKKFGAIPSSSLPKNEGQVTNQSSPMDKLNQQTFSNGWRAIKIPKHKFSLKKHHQPQKNTNLEDQRRKTSSLHSTTVTSTTSLPMVTEFPTSSPSITEESFDESSGVNNLDRDDRMEIITSNSTSIPISITTSVATTTTSTFSEKCILDSQEYHNGDTIPSSSDDPCEYCRCFYGKKMCQRQKCPPSSLTTECISELKTGQCCPLFICKINNSSDDTNLTLIIDRTKILNETKPEITAIRKGPQFSDAPESPDPVSPPIPQLSIDQGLEERSVKQQEKSIDLLPYHLEPKLNPYIPDRSIYNVDQRRRIALPFIPFDFLYKNPIKSRIHFRDSNRPPVENGQFSGGTNNIPFSRINPSILAILSSQQQPPLFSPIVPNNLNDLEPSPSPSMKSTKPVPSIGPQSPIRTLPQSPIQLNAKPLKVMDKMPESTPIPNQITTESSKLLSSSTSSPFPSISTVKTINIGNILQLSGCNIYGKVYKIDEEIKELGNQCKMCVCDATGVDCIQKC